MTEYTRRASDKIPHDIEAMIMEEDDPKQRAFLIVLNSINNSMVANTKATKEVTEKLEKHLDNFEAHAANEEALMNKGKGAWRVMAWVIGAVQVVGLGIWQQARTDIAAIHQAIQTGQVQHAQFEARINTLEKK